MRRILFLLAASLGFAQPSTAPIRIFVGARKAVTVTVPHVNKQNIAEIVSFLFAKGDEPAAARFREVLRDSGDLTLVVTTADGDGGVR